VGEAGTYISPFLQFRIRPWGPLEAAGVIAAVGTVGMFWGEWAWWLDLLANFPLQYAVLFLALAVGQVIMRQRVAWGSLALCGVNLALAGPVLIPRATPPTSCKGPIARGVVANVNARSGDPARVRALLRETEADLVVLLEVDHHWLGEMAGWTQVVVTRSDEFSLALHTRHLIHRVDILTLGGVPAVVAEVGITEGRVTVVGTHPVPPGGSSRSALRNEHLEQLARIVRGLKGPILVLGDLNATPSSPHFRRFVSASELAPARALPTWPSFLGPVGIPLDHVLYRGLCIRDVRLGPRVGSDHLPLVVDFHSD
jgi:endonuclease/exonuclease/phosphatase (EEP) superfamily protein YafD